MATELPHGAKSRMSETSWAILGSVLISIVLATIMVGNPFRALSLAYLDYSHTPAGGAAEASTTQAPGTQAPGTQAPGTQAPGTQAPGTQK